MQPHFAVQRFQALKVLCIHTPGTFCKKQYFSVASCWIGPNIRENNASSGAHCKHQPNTQFSTSKWLWPIFSICISDCTDYHLDSQCFTAVDVWVINLSIRDLYMVHGGYKKDKRFGMHSWAVHSCCVVVTVAGWQKPNPESGGALWALQHFGVSLTLSTNGNKMAFLLMTYLVNCKYPSTVPHVQCTYYELANGHLNLLIVNMQTHFSVASFDMQMETFLYLLLFDIFIYLATK